MAKDITPPANYSQRAAEIMSRYRPIAPRPQIPGNFVSPRPEIPERFINHPHLRNLWYEIQEGPVRTRKRRVIPLPEPPMKRPAIGIFSPFVLAATPLSCLPPRGCPILPSTKLSLGAASSVGSVSLPGAASSIACSITSPNAMKSAHLGTRPTTAESSSRGGALKTSAALNTRLLSTASSACSVNSQGTAKAARLATRQAAKSSFTGYVKQSATLRSRPVVATASSACNATPSIHGRSATLTTQPATAKSSVTSNYAGSAIQSFACGTNKPASLSIPPAAAASFACNVTSQVTANASRLDAYGAATPGHAPETLPILPNSSTQQVSSTSLACNATFPVTTTGRPALIPSLASCFITSSYASRMIMEASQTYSCRVTTSQATKSGIPTQTCGVPSPENASSFAIKSSLAEASACDEKPLLGTPISELSSFRFFPASYACNVMNSSALASSSGLVPFLVLSSPSAAVSKGAPSLPESSKAAGKRVMDIDLNTIAEGHEEKDQFQLMGEPILFATIKPMPVGLVASKIIITLIADGLFYHRSTLRACPVEVIEEKMKSDVLASVVTDSNNQVRLANSAYIKLVGQPKCEWSDGLYKGKMQVGARTCCGPVDLQIKNAKIPAMSKGFSCSGIIEWEKEGMKKLLSTSADAVRVICQKSDYKFIWRFFTSTNGVLETTDKLYE